MLKIIKTGKRIITKFCFSDYFSYICTMIDLTEIKTEDLIQRFYSNSECLKKMVGSIYSNALSDETTQIFHEIQKRVPDFKNVDDKGQPIFSPLYHFPYFGL